MNFKNISIRKSLIIGFGTTILISAVIIIASLIMMNVQKSAYSDIIDKYMGANQMVSDCRIDYNIAARNLRDVVLSGDISSLTTTNTKIDELTSRLADLRETYPLSDKSLLENFTRTVEEWEVDAKEIGEVVRTDQQRAADMIVTTCSPKLAAAAAAGDALATELQAAQEEIIKTQNRNSTIGLLVIVAVMVLATVAVLMMAFQIIRSIVEPSNQVRAALVGFSQGSLNIPVSFEGKNELGEMCDALRTSQKVLHSVIQDISGTTGQMAKGNFDVELTANFPGDLAPIQQSINQFVLRMSETISNISQSADQVSAGSDQVSNSSQSLAQGATEQASAVEELSATINDISTNSKQTAASAEEARASVGEAGAQVSASNEYVKQLNVAMSNISTSSEEIGKIIATIENIAFQTNILALNAAVEAARAGTAGKGFAVVADEVRSLAAQSDEAAKATKELIENSVQATTRGRQIVGEVSQTLKKTLDLVTSSNEGIGNIAQAVQGEAMAISQVTEGIGQISAVVQTNSASSEESAAVSTELFDQVRLLQEQTNRFRLKQ